jgi:type 1 glutamine amidotransferase
MRNATLVAFCATAFLVGLPAKAAGPIRVMLLDGESDGPYHKWQATTPVLKKQLDETGLFQTDVVTAPPADGDFSKFKPEFGKYQVVVFNYNAPDERWPADVKASFEKYMKDGGGLVLVHAACVGFPGWEAFNQMMGIGGWRARNEKAGPYWFFKDGKLISDNSPGNAGSHGARLPFRITVQNANHPITKGLPPVFLHHGDELYARLRGPGGMTVLATSYSDASNRGTGNEEPALMVLSYGKGRVFSSVLGHDVTALSSVDAVVTFQRGTEWAATGKVTQKVPASFPTAATVSYRADLAAMDPNYSKGLNPLDAATPGRSGTPGTATKSGAGR